MDSPHFAVMGDDEFDAWLLSQPVSRPAKGVLDLLPNHDGVHEWFGHETGTTGRLDVLDGKAIACPDCGMVSYNANDVREGYCGRCHQWTSAPWYREAQLLHRRQETAE